MGQRGNAYPSTTPVEKKLAMDVAIEKGHGGLPRGMSSGGILFSLRKRWEIVCAVKVGPQSDYVSR